MGHRQSVQTQIRHRIMRCLIRIFTACLQNVYLNFEINGEKTKQHPYIWKWAHLTDKGWQVRSALTLCLRETPKKGTFTNSENPDEMSHNAAFHLGIHVCEG